MLRNEASFQNPKFFGMLLVGFIRSSEVVRHRGIRSWASSTAALKDP